MLSMSATPLFNANSINFEMSREQRTANAIRINSRPIRLKFVNNQPSDKHLTKQAK
tara:strand:- start:385 stop:552 length:168 start_codon:yes stop_codon:yes gene_type:complete